MTHEKGRIRFAVSVAKQGGSAVKRNRIKRLIREAARLQFGLLSGSALPPGTSVDIVFRLRRTDQPTERYSLRHFGKDMESIYATISGRMRERT
jgi:RNase P protein component